MRASRLRRQLPASFGQFERPVGLTCHQSFALEPRDYLGDRDMADVEPPRQIDDAALSLLSLQRFNRFDVVLSRFLRMVAPRAAVAIRKSGRLAHDMVRFCGL